jgi:hypothetical protein
VRACADTDAAAVDVAAASVLGCCDDVDVVRLGAVLPAAVTGAGSNSADCDERSVFQTPKNVFHLADDDGALDNVLLVATAFVDVDVDAAGDDVTAASPPVLERRSRTAPCQRDRARAADADVDDDRAACVGVGVALALESLTPSGEAFMNNSNEMRYTHKIIRYAQHTRTRAYAPPPAPAPTQRSARRPLAA